MIGEMRLLMDTLRRTREEFGLISLGNDNYGLTISQIEKIHFFKYDKVPFESEEICIICYDLFEQNDSVNMLKCKHKFHKNCLLPWVQKNNKCPICRFKIEV